MRLRFLAVWLSAGVGLSGCNEIFGIEAGVPIQSVGAGGSEVMRDGGSGGAVTPGGGGAQGGGAVVELEGRDAEPPPQAAAGGGGSAGVLPDAGRGGGASLPPGLALVDEALVFIGGAFSHSLGVTGTLATTRAALGATIEPDCGQDPSCFSMLSGGLVCVRGSAGQVIDNDFVNRWGVNLQLNMSGAGWDRAGGSIRGISFRLGGAALPQMRFHATRPPTNTESYSNYCQELEPVDGQRVDVLFDELKVGCWDPAAADALPEAALVNTLAWQINAVSEAAKPFDFCISELRPIIAVE